MAGWVTVVAQPNCWSRKPGTDGPASVVDAFVSPPLVGVKFPTLANYRISGAWRHRGCAVLSDAASREAVERSAVEDSRVRAADNVDYVISDRPSTR